MVELIITLLIILLVELLFSPRLDKTVKGDVLLWYGRKERDYIFLWIN